MPRELHRRRFVVQSMAGSLALPAFVSLADSPSAPLLMTQGAGIGARRFVAIGNLLGFQRQHFFPQTSGKDFKETPLLRPLLPLREQITIYRGFDHGLRGGHFAVHSFLSGVLHHESKHRPHGNVTVDQFIADEVGKQTRFPSLTVGSEGGIHGGCQLSWTKAGVRVPPITGPAELFEKLFVTESATSRLAAARANAVQGSILDSVRDEVSGLARKVNAEDRSRLDEYLTAVRDVEKRVEARRRWQDQPKPTPPLERPVDRNFVDDLPMLYELIALALQTDSTRVATLEIGGSFLPQHLGIDKSYHTMSHHGNDEKTIADLMTLETYQIEQFAKFLDRLSGIRDGEQSLLDSTAVLFGSGMGDANKHTNSDLPIVMAGGGYGTGGFKQLPDKGAGKVPLCNLLLGIIQRTGVPADTFGSSTGAYTEA
jgi:hypothetical protein